MSGSVGVQKVLLKLSKSVQEGNYYEAHQMYHSVCQRYLKQKKTAEAIELLHNGIFNMLEHKQTGSALDLFERLLDVFDKQTPALSSAHRACILSVFAAFPLDAVECDQFTKLCTRWSIKHQDNPFGDPQIHHMFGSKYFQHYRYYDAESHFVHGNIDSAKALGVMAAEWVHVDEAMDQGYPIARAVLQLLVMGKIDDAKIALSTFLKIFVEDHPNAIVSTQRLSGRDLPVFTSAYLNFAQLTIECIDRQAGDLYMNLVHFYTTVLGEDGYMLTIAETIAAAYFDQGPRKKQDNPLMNMMKGLFAGPPSGQAQQNQITEMD
ncbi:hypothetical protein O5D80_008367 [Batrachochytrium dendrobatidis]|nr:hypothetical protein O5D80_008367 [Batrachochytrium dendrobatidis]